MFLGVAGYLGRDVCYDNILQSLAERTNECDCVSEFILGDERSTVSPVHKMIPQPREFFQLIFCAGTCRASALCSQNRAQLRILSHAIPAVVNVNVLKCRVE